MKIVVQRYLSLAKRWSDLLSLMERNPRIFVLALVLLLVAMDGYHVWHERYHTATFGGMSWDIAESLRKGEGYSFIATEYFPFSSATNKVSAAREPVPVLLFAAIGVLSDGSHHAVAAFHILVRVLTLFGVVALARQIVGVKAALLAALAWVLYLPAIREVPAKEVDLVASVFVVWALVFFIRAWIGGEHRWWVVSGLVFGCAVLSRSALFAVGSVLAVLLLLRARGKLGPGTQPLGLRPFVLFTLSLALVQLPWFVRNYIVFGRPVIGTTLAGYNLYRQNHFLEQGKLIPFVAGPSTERALQELIARSPWLTGHENEAEFDQFLREESLRIIAAYPGQYALLSGYRFFTLWFNWGVPEAYGGSPNKTDYVMMVYQALIVGLALFVGMRTHREHAGPLLLAAGAFTLIHMAVAARMLYTIAAIPILLPVAAQGMIKLRSRHRLASVIVPTAVLLWFLYAVQVDLGRLPFPSP